MPRRLSAQLQAQLVGRYMNELGTTFGVFVVAWMGMPSPPRCYRPQWGSLSTAREELDQQVLAASSATGGTDVRAVVIDASLPVLPGTRAKARQKRTAKPRLAATARPKAKKAAHRNVNPGRSKRQPKS